MLIVVPSYSATIDVASPADALYAYVADLTRHGEWSADPLEVRSSGGGRFTSRTRSKGKEIDAELSVVEQLPPRRFSFDAADLTGRWRHTFTFEPSGAGTRVTRRISGSLSGAQLALYWLVLLPVKKPNAKRALQRLKERMEGP
jgi:Polyketide cyclase / dehydrase and lipid transport